MSLSDKARQLTDKAKQYAAGNKDKIAKGVEKAEQVADTKTGGRYHDQIAKAGQRADDMVAKLPTQPEQPHTQTTPPPNPPAQDPPGNAPA